jgi:hypothetical protein
MYVGDHDEEACELLALANAELARLLDRVDRVAARIGEADRRCALLDSRSDFA